MRVLVLGNSDTRGAFAPQPTWTAVAEQSLTETGHACEFVERGFSPRGEKAVEFIEKLIEAHGPDIVILPLGTFAFSVGFTWVRVERLTGKRLGRRVRRMEEAFDAQTRQPGAKPGRLNRAARTIARKIVGAAPLTSRSALEEDYRRVLAALAKHETTQVLLVAYPPERGELVKVRDLDAQRAAFLATVTAAAAARRYVVLDSAPLFAGASSNDRLLTDDGFHLESAGHQILGGATAAALAEMLGGEAEGRD